ncbi:hypothetical protein [Kiloniella sp.]|uniref:hypothetical protein n=1 Tax=Kiloniella sp. TaxID=1938587 RepID=UPI003B01CAFD
MMDQLYANQPTPNFPVNGIAVSSISPVTPDLDLAKKKPEPENSFKSSLESTQSSPKETPAKKANPPVRTSASEKAISETTPDETVGEAEQEFGFLDFLDIINPLQHIPVVSTIYREITGDELKPTARVFGGMLFGGPSGFVSAIANSIVEETTGKDIGANIMEAFLSPDEVDDTVQIAESGVANGQVTSPLSTEAIETASLDVTDIFARLPPVAPPAPTLTNSDPTVSDKQNTLLDAQSSPSPTEPLQGQAALAAIYNDLGRIRSNTNQDLASQSLQVAEVATTKNGEANQQHGSPGKWFPLTGNNVIIAQTSAPLPARNPSINTAPPSVDTPERQPKIDPLSQSEFTQNLLNGLNKYQELQTQ